MNCNGCKQDKEVWELNGCFEEGHQTILCDECIEERKNEL